MNSTGSNLRRYDTTWPWRNILKMPRFLIIKMRFNNRGSPSYFLSSRGQKVKPITKIEQKRLFAFLFSLFMVFLTQRLIYTIYIDSFLFGTLEYRKWKIKNIKLNIWSFLIPLCNLLLIIVWENWGY